MARLMFPFIKGVHERSQREIVWLFVVVPIVIGIALAALVGFMTLRHGREFAGRDWLAVAWAAALCAALWLGLPMTARRELQRRRALSERKASAS
jgi:hypothetical protein